MECDTIRCDVLVIGGGGAALRAAISAREAGADVLIVSKGRAGRSGATYHSVAEVGAFNVPDGVVDPSDNPAAFYKDMCDASLSVARLKLCEILAERAEDALLDLERMGKGAIFARENGRYKVYQACFSTKPRSHVVENHFKPILDALYAEVVRLGIPTCDDYIAGLLTGGAQIVGAIGINTDGRQQYFRAKSVVLATGGASRLFQRNLYPPDITGDGYAMALRAGAAMTNMEFVQAGVGVASPFINLFGNYLWEGHPILCNAEGNPFLQRYLPDGMSEVTPIDAKTHFPFSARDSSRWLEIAMQSEIKAGRGTKNGNIYLDFRGVNFADLEKRHTNFASMWDYTYRWHLEKGVDLLRSPVEVACFAHAINGGVLIDENAQSTIPGLFCAGEIAAGPHGADRLGGNMAMTCQVFGKIAGESAAARAASITTVPEPDADKMEAQHELLTQFAGHGALKLTEILMSLQNTAQNLLLIVREGRGLKGCLDKLDDLERVLIRETTVKTPEERKHALEIINLIETGRLIARAAMERKESRGSHYRSDYPKTDNTLAKNLILTNRGDRWANL